LNKAMPLGWATDELGVSTEDAHRVLENFKNRAGGGLLPLGGEGEEFSGHKGFGLALWVDIFCAVLSGAASANMVYPRAADGKPLPPDLGHFFGAWRLEAFRPINEFKAAMDDLQRRLKATPKAPGQERIYIPGEKEYEATERYLVEGVPLNLKVADDLKALGLELDVTWDF
jgi:L-2-hydroxycarboxylate dehydrogenase (NAD+)